MLHTGTAGRGRTSHRIAVFFWAGQFFVKGACGMGCGVNYLYSTTTWVLIVLSICQPFESYNATMGSPKGTCTPGWVSWTVRVWYNIDCFKVAWLHGHGPVSPTQIYETNEVVLKIGPSLISRATASLNSTDISTKGVETLIDLLNSRSICSYSFLNVAEMQHTVFKLPPVANLVQYYVSSPSLA